MIENYDGLTAAKSRYAAVVGEKLTDSGLMTARREQGVSVAEPSNHTLNRCGRRLVVVMIG